MFARSVRRVATTSACGSARRSLAHASPEQEAAKAAAISLRQARGMKAKNPPAWNDASVDTPFLKPRPAGAPREDWEISWYLLMGGSFLLLGLGELNRPDRGPENWARDEAEERLRRQEAGEENERLHNYAPGTVDRKIQYEDRWMSAPKIVQDE